MVMLVTTARRTEGIPVGVIFTPVILGEERERETKSIKHHKPHQKIRCWLTSMWREKVRLNYGDKKRDSGVAERIV